MGAQASAQAVADALYGLHGMSDSEETRRLVFALTWKVIEVTAREGLDPNQYSQALYGVQALGDSDELKELYTALRNSLQKRYLVSSQSPESTLQRCYGGFHSSAFD